MFDKNMFRRTDNMTVKELIEYLKNIPDDYRVRVNGDRYGYLHVDTENHDFVIDDTTRSDEYNSDPDTFKAVYSVTVYGYRCEKSQYEKREFLVAARTAEEARDLTGQYIRINNLKLAASKWGISSVADLHYTVEMPCGGVLAEKAILKP